MTPGEIDAERSQSVTPAAAPFRARPRSDAERTLLFCHLKIEWYDDVQLIIE